MNKTKLLVFGALAFSALTVMGYYSEKSGMADGVQRCFNNSVEGSPSDCIERAAAFEEKYGHPYNLN